ncbi:Cell wall-associated hydrolases (invasion-associated proteins) [Corynebacterium glutamicum ATCC 13032]|uniref:Cell wall-associated hydrolases (Invasion-associated proteins) n=1 Tax=Corynebacterium glutamicum (strain ATCC 13032 / DSM 20300 / JCM 1318 / BCRC 11384 / CCUG 27702 / LMG 3730 / NBRC 12168 / NCIMB 10025 / NRRL B-2784 / 534) TaxID=196627 RepID=Q8NQA0_CORGL|nr:Chain A, Cell wall-associated hydrolases (Invasion-associated proteins) [Corynebacterium glutamicum ATCC 13032]8AUC_B Chain B, Cell wall-associated hydrolases (Invasion-associated proteins) [Corynebacterium glutamicum ATCC 13032]BAB98931.1 Cell wall-associated hydrolases (invasion-associated proteins) [Corynebacterium glutamicum ATCC 13032]
MIALAVSGALLSSMTPAVAQPQNPDDAAIAQAEENVSAGDGEVARLAGSLSSTDAEINRVELEMGALREEVNKSLVDLHDAQAIAEQARQDALAAKKDLDDSQAQIEAAQERLDEISRAAYRQNGTSKGLSGISGNGNSEDALDRQTYLRTSAEKQQAAVEELDRLRTENANKESVLRQARIVAEQREAEAVEKQVQTEAAIAANSEQLNVLTNNRSTLVAQRDGAERNLAIARAQADNLQGQRAEYEEFQQAEQARIQAEAEAQAAAEEKRRADEAAAQAAAEAQEAAQQAQAAEEAQAAQAAETAQAQAAQAAETQAAQAAQAQAEANDRAAAQQRAAEAQAAAEQAQREADAQAANDAQAQALREQALTAASIAAAALIAASQSSHATTQNPYPTDEDADPTDIADIQGPTQPGTGESGDSQSNSSDNDSTGNDSTGSDSSDSDSSGNDSSEVISGDRSAQIETVIARAMSQLGVQYAWGGGNANGPTLGIRDGGVADSYGDYNKVGFDCSGLTLYAFAGVGISLPHYTGYQYQHGTKVSPSEMQRGDLIFYGPGASQHVAIYLGDGQMIEAPNSGSVVKISPVRWSGMTESVVRLI